MVPAMAARDEQCICTGQKEKAKDERDRNPHGIAEDSLLFPRLAQAALLALLNQIRRATWKKAAE
tara:strand:+ start:3556 stop:3750 length:195 start_codon:yes stop_codon:yes gene_type:complete